ncbi:MAG: SDR family oxidoreductase [Planctomycetaceae bacterium]|nr:SDR family oxidoreductase [Planctomycetaceae bacterium]
MKLAGKRALITGGGSGIGRAIALLFAGEGCQVAIAGRRLDKLETVAAEYRGTPRILTHAVDVADRTSVDALFAWAARELGPIDILVNNAGINLPKRTMSELAPEDWDRLLSVNATGAYNCLRAVLPQMREREDGLVINISSISGKRAGVLGGVGYNASKFAMTALATTVAVEEAQRRIRVSSIFPGEVETPILEHRPVPVSAERRAQILQPEDVAAAALMIALLPPRAHVPELVIKPTVHEYV